MGWLFPLLLLAWPVVEIAVLIQIADWIGWIAAIGVIVLSGMAGGWLLRQQGLATARQMQAEMRHGVMPVGALFDQACLAVAGLLLLLPGFITDLLALALLLPPLRVLLRGALLRRFVAGQTPGGSPAGPTTVIDADFTIIDDDRPDPTDRDQPPRLGR